MAKKKIGEQVIDNYELPNGQVVVPKEPVVVPVISAEKGVIKSLSELKTKCAPNTVAYEINQAIDLVQVSGNVAMFIYRLDCLSSDANTEEAATITAIKDRMK